MKDSEGSIILEKLSEFGLVDEFMEAVDSDNFPRIISILREADIEEDDITRILDEIENGASL